MTPTPTGHAIIIEVAEGYDDERTLYEMLPEVAGAEPRLAPETAVQAFDSYRAECRSLSEQASMQLVQVGVPEHIAPGDLRVAPSRDGSNATIVDDAHLLVRIVDMETGESIVAPVEEPMEPLAWCRDGEHLAICERVPGSVAAVARVVVLHLPSGQKTSSIEVGPTVEDVAWSPDCTQLAMIVGKHRSGRGLLERFGALMGHGVPYYDFRLLVVDLGTQGRMETPIAEDVRYGIANLLWDERAVTSLADEVMSGRISSAQR